MATVRFTDFDEWKRAAVNVGARVRRTTKGKKNTYHQAVKAGTIVGFFNEGLHDGHTFAGELFGTLTGAPKPQLARERKITGTGVVSVKESILKWCEAPKRACWSEEGKMISDSSQYIEIVKRERIDDSDGEPALYITMADGSEWLVKPEKMR